MNKPSSLRNSYSDNSLIVAAKYLSAINRWCKIDLQTCLVDSDIEICNVSRAPMILNGQRKLLHASEAPATVLSLNGAKAQKQVHYKAINARYKVVRMHGNYLRTNQPKPNGQRQLSVKKSSTSTRMVLLHSCTSYDTHWELLHLFFFFLRYNRKITRKYIVSSYKSHIKNIL